MRKTFWQLLLWTCLITLCVAPVWAQGEEPQLTLRLRRYFGYGGLGGDIQGNFRLLVSGPQDLTRVVFLMDSETMGEVTQPPWQFSFHTDNFPPGSHTISAIGYTRTGLELRSNSVRARFLTTQEAGRTTSQLIIMLLGGIFAITALSFAITALLSRGKTPHAPLGVPSSYGISGGAICPRCKRPFARHWWSPNLGFSKLERCPYCGKWSLARAASPQELAAAEAAELQSASADLQSPVLSEEERLRRDLENSRYEDQ